MFIKYHDNTTGIQYGEDHTLTNNWNPILDYGNEYVRVYFRIDTKGYGYPDFSFNEEDRNAFYHDIASTFIPLGWISKNPQPYGCPRWTNGLAHLYMHPQELSGEVLKNDVRIIAENLAAGTKVFTLRWVDLYETSYIMTDEEYETRLTAKDPEIRADILNAAKTNRRNQFRYTSEIAWGLADKYRICRPGDDDGRYNGRGKTHTHILGIIRNLIDEGYLIEYKEPDSYTTYIRTINKTEQKKLKLYI